MSVDIFAPGAVRSRSIAAAYSMIIYRIADGRIAEHWLQFDGAALVAQLQNVPSAATA